jgi:hypothetical protein
LEKKGAITPFWQKTAITFIRECTARSPEIPANLLSRCLTHRPTNVP